MKQYCSFNGFYSIVLMALVDAEYSFIWAAVGTRGNTRFYSVTLHGSPEKSCCRGENSQRSSTGVRR